MKRLNVSSILAAAVSPLRSRKVRTALAAILYAYLGERLGWSEEQIYIGVGVLTAIILGTALEDHGRNMTLPPGEPKK